MLLAITCPHCKQSRVQTIRRVWFLYGFLLIARYGARNIIGCTACVKKQTWNSLLRVSLGGWWCFPWGLATPVVIIQNLVQALAAPRPDRERAAMAQALAIANVHLADVEVAPDAAPAAV